MRSGKPSEAAAWSFAGAVRCDGMAAGLAPAACGTPPWERSTAATVKLLVRWSSDEHRRTLNCLNYASRDVRRKPVAPSCDVEELVS